MPCKKIIYFYFPRFIKAVPITGPGFLQQIFLRFLCIEFMGIGLYVHTLDFRKPRRKISVGSDRCK